MKFFNEYFVFSSSERRGVFLFTLLLLLLIALYFLMPYIIKQNIPNYDKFEKHLALLNNQQKSAISSPEVTKNSLFYFNPNLISKAKLEKLGLTSKQASTIINYREKVGDFKSASDFRKVYGISDDKFNKLTPFLVFEKKVDKIDEQDDTGKSVELKPFPFNPNNATKKELKDIGFNKKQVSQIINYRNKGGKFYKKDDFKKIYAISNTDYAQVEPFILLENDTKQENNEETFVLDINKATQEEFRKIRGIGEKRSATIIKYRNYLGGFYDINQLKEVYGMDVSVIENNDHHFSVEIKNLKKLNINKLEIKELAQHPYVSYNQARIIVNYRKVHGLFTTVDEIKSNNLLEDKDYSKIAPYLIVK